MPCRRITSRIPQKRIFSRRQSTLQNVRQSQTAALLDSVNLLRATAAFVPRALAHNPRQRSVWDGILGRAVEESKIKEERPARLVVYGTNPGATQNLVNALLDEPFASDEQIGKILRSRWAEKERGPLRIDFGAMTSTSDVLQLPLPFLNRYAVPLSVIETSNPADLDNADIAVVVTSVDELSSLSINRPDALFVVDMDASDVRHPPKSRSNEGFARQYIFVSPTEASNAISSLKQHPDSPAAVQEFQAKFIGSRMSAFTRRVDGILASLPNNLALQERTMVAQTEGALAVCQTALEEAWAELNTISRAVGELSAATEKEYERIDGEVFGDRGQHAVDQAIYNATQTMKLKMELSKWPRMASSVDELPTYLATTVRRIWCVELEKDLIFHSGRLEQIQASMTAQTMALVKQTNVQSLKSPVLQNTLDQLVSSPNFRVQPTTLPGPLAARSDLLLDAPTARFHRAAQRALLRMIGTAIGGMAISWSGYLGYLSSNGGLAASLGIGLEPGTALATGVFGAVFGVYWSTMSWDKGKREWWGQFERVLGGSKVDLKETLQKTLHEQVLVVPRTACQDLTIRIGKRERELELLQGELNDLKQQLERSKKRN
ncbi:unnamed protein product [Mycena citricolor]|uniref:Uncharacterized protein n=1 Tax=Mycena citricolor TaxID=2018698 RepID=A0AAD2HMA2_9AGAR|nr:unnamed protein product [Mycena citricolor]